jgi:uncharacterized membrane protein YphA (DoxX/SURF4 family)
MNITIWILQGIMAALFLMAGLMKAIQPKSVLKEKIGTWIDDFPTTVLKGIGVLEILGAIGLILPMLIHKFEFLTPLAAAGLALTMLGAIMIHLKRKEKKEVFINLIILALLISVFISRKALLF